MAALTAIPLCPVVRFREFPFGTATDPSMREFMTAQPWEGQDQVLAYLRSGLVLGATMGADLTDWFARPEKANPEIAGHLLGGTTEMTDGAWFWYAGLIYFIEKYNVRVPEEFIRHAAHHGWRVDQDRLQGKRFAWSYFDDSQRPLPVPFRAEEIEGFRKEQGGSSLAEFRSWMDNQ